MRYPESYYSSLGVEPDFLWQSAEGRVLTFIVGDFEGKGEYGIIYSDRLGAMHGQLVTFHAEAMKKAINSPKPLYFGRVGDIEDEAYLGFWEQSYIDYFTESDPRLSGEDMDGYKKKVNNGIYLQILKTEIVPLLFRTGVVKRGTLWWDSDQNFQGQISRQGVLNRSTVSTPPKKTYSLNGREKTKAELAAMLHVGTDEQRNEVSRFLCEQDDPDLKDLKSRVDCTPPSSKKRFFMDKPQIGGESGIQFRRQESLDRAYDSLRGASRRARLLHLLIR